MKFSDDTWIRVDDADGNRLEAGTFRNGQEISVAHDGELHLIIGRTQNVELSYAGEAVDLSRFKSGGVGGMALSLPLVISLIVSPIPQPDSDTLSNTANRL